ncbi:MAG: NUDIX domain-containing protein [Nocardioides sp.]|nr:NUDIX domain-containing protein [Nocardioides sp.]
MDLPDFDTRLAAYAVILDNRDRLLLALWNEPADPLWTMPGGGIDLEESIEEGLVRELREETGYEVEVGPLLGLDTHVVPGERRRPPAERPRKAVRVFYAATIVGGELTREVDGTTDEARWFPLEEVPSLARVSSVDRALAFLGPGRLHRQGEQHSRPV